MPNVLTMASNVTCGHGPSKVAVSSTAKLTINNQPVLTKSGIQSKPVSGCTTPTDPNSGSKLCTTVSSVTAGEAVKLTVGGEKVVHDLLIGETDGTVSSVKQFIKATAGQVKLTTV